jgi:uncharacterized delta-60 repeat protein
MPRARAISLLSAAFCSLVLVVPAARAATAGTLDPAFGTSGWTLTAQTGSYAVAGGVALQADGKAVSAGQWRTPSGVDVAIVVRTRTDGTLDPSFGQGGVVTFREGIASSLNAVTIQPDGRIVVAGTALTGGAFQFMAARLLPNGGLDASFGSDGIVSVAVGWAAMANAVAIGADGRIALGGTVRLDANDPQSVRATVVRLRADGSLDPSFGLRGASMVPGTAAAWGLVAMPDGGFALAGQYGVDTWDRSYLVARLRPNGTRDPSFGIHGMIIEHIGTVGIAFALARRPDGDLVVTGNAFDRGSTISTLVVRPDGRRETSFGVNGLAEVPTAAGVNALALQGDGRIVLAGTGGTTIRLGATGTPDPTFGTGGTAVTTLGSNTAANGVAVQGDGTIVLAGSVTLPDGTRPFAVWRLLG